MPMSKDFVKHVHALIYERLTNLGFQKRKPGILTLKISDDAFGWIGLNMAIYSGEGSVTINPVVGIRNQRMEKIVAELCGSAFSDFIPASFAGNIGYIAPEDNYHTYNFHPDEYAEPIVDELVSYIEEHGVPFMKKNADLTALVKSMQTPTLRLGNSDLSYRLPVGLFLLGRVDEARAALNKYLDRLGNSKDPGSECYRRFAAKLNELIG